ncbi:MAG: MFS transporter [Acidimicrobiales bacterium]
MAQRISTNATRGRLLAAYQIVTMGGMAVGQLLLSVDNPNDYPLFIVCSVLCSFALVPIALSTTSAPPILIPEAIPLRMAGSFHFRLVSALLIGGIQGTFMGLLAVYATRAGLTASQVSRLLFTPMVGAVIFQYPIGYLSDRVSRRGVMLADCAVVALLATTMLQIDPASLVAVGLMFFFGGAIFPLYSLSLAYMNDWVPTNKMVGASATFVVASGIGAASGPIAGGAIMSVFGNQYFWVALLGPTLTLASFLIWRIVFSDPVAIERKGMWVPVASRGSAVAAAVMAAPRRRAVRKSSATGGSVNAMETNQKHEGKTPPAS